MSRYLVGIDLGTTHCVVAFADSRAPAATPEVLPIDQLVAPGELAARRLLPSMRYHPAAGEVADADRTLPWDVDPAADPVPDAIIGTLAQELGSKVPGRLVTSAKSWLSHSGIDRTAHLLPWGAPEEVSRISPLAASASYLRYIRCAWNHRFPDEPLEAQDIVLTVPASFDEVARQLTVQAARLGGLPRIHLVEEPQAACYDWLAQHNDELETALAGVHSLLVCDVGGGTTDLTLIRVDRRSGHPQLSRIGVGDHLMLGGDNMDLALAHLAEHRLISSGKQLTTAQLSQLVQQCRAAKETLLSHDAPETARVTVLGTGAQLIGQARTTELTRDEVAELVVDGFFPETGRDECPQRRRAGIVEFGLPYAADPAVTRHLAAFIADHATALKAAMDDYAPAGGDFPVPDAVLLNGGVFLSDTLSDRLIQVLARWRGAPLRRLCNDQPELAVARGAVAYALARRGRGARIGGGSARSYLLKVEDELDQAQRAVCLLPRGSEEGQEMRLTNRIFSLRLGQPVRFNLLATTSDRSWTVGELVDVDGGEFQALPPLVAVLDAPPGAVDRTREVSVQLAANLTEVGTLEIDCVATEDAPADVQRRWHMAFQLRSTGAESVAAAAAKLPATFPQAVERLEQVFGARVAGRGPQEAKQLQRDLEKLLGRRTDWDTHVLRELFDTLWDGVKRRRRSALHERLWFNLAGFCLRPGYGYPLDDWRIHQLWSIYEQGIQYRDDPRNPAEWWTLWRRVAGGLDESQQLRLLSAAEDRLRTAAPRRKLAAKTTAYDDMVRLVAGLERLPAEDKTRVGELLLSTKRTQTGSAQRWWALGRLGARVPLHGSIHNIVPRDVAKNWLEEVLRLDWRAVEPAAFAATQLARRSGDRERDLDVEVRERVAALLRKANAPPRWIDMLQVVTEIDSADESRIFGESLPPGLRLVS